jgi:hypothetical protein
LAWQLLPEWEGASSGALAATGKTVATVNIAKKTNGIRNLRMIHLPRFGTELGPILMTAGSSVKARAGCAGTRRTKGCKYRVAW